MTIKLLVVDDSKAMRAYVRGSLKGTMECEIDEVPSGFEALRFLTRNKYNLIISDIHMPDINGLELIHFIRESKNHRDVPIIIISTQASAKDKAKALGLGANKFISKPFKPKDISNMVASYLLLKENEA